MQISRRGFGAAMSSAIGGIYAATGHPLVAKSGSAGLVVGVQTYSFRDMLQTPGDMVDKMIAGCRQVGINLVELFEPTIQPPEFSLSAAWATVEGKPSQASLFGRPPEGPPPASVLATRERIREWRLATPISHFQEIGARFRASGIKIHAFNFGLSENCTDAEIDRAFVITKALGTRVMTASTTLKMARRTAPFAASHKVVLGLHGHSNLKDPNQLATPESFELGLAMSPFYKLNFDIGHFAAAGFDVIGFLNKHHQRIDSIHVKDRKLGNGPNAPLGEGDTPLAEAISVIVRNRWNIPAFLEYEYAGADSVTELKRMKAFVTSTRT